MRTRFACRERARCFSADEGRAVACSWSYTVSPFTAPAACSDPDGVAKASLVEWKGMGRSRRGGDRSIVDIARGAGVANDDAWWARG